MQNEVPFLRAADSGDVAAVRALIEAHVNVNSSQEVCSK